MNRLRRATALVAMSLAVATGTAGAITTGSIDGTNHPNVAMIVFQTPEGRFRCSATLVSPTVLVTAAHCSDATVGKTIVTFDPIAPPLGAAPDPLTGYVTGVNIPPGYLTGVAHAHPLWTGKLSLNDLHDAGVVVLDAPVAGITPASLAPAGYLDTLAKKATLQKSTFELIGYGVFFEKPASGPQKPVSVRDLTRRFTTAPGQTVTSQVLKLQENPGDSREGGGTCFGDSGGPVLNKGYLVGDTSFGASQFCQGWGGYYRLDTADARDFLDDYITLT